jgi:hypothetical protein
MYEQHDTQPPFSRCFRCPNGCIHLTCGNFTVNLAPMEFLVLAEAVNAMRHQLREEARSAREESAQAQTNSFTM